MSYLGMAFWIARIVGLVVIGFSAVQVALSPAPAPATTSPPPAYESASDLLAAARYSDKVNQKNTDNVYQQQVVNGWVARDLLEAQVEQLDRIGAALADPAVVTPAENDNRPVQLLMWAVLAICWFGITSPAYWPKKAPPAPVAGAPAEGAGGHGHTPAPNAP